MPDNLLFNTNLNITKKVKPSNFKLTINNFSTVISLLNTNWKISAKIKKSGHYGTLSWDGNDFKIMDDLENHI